MQGLILLAKGIGRGLGAVKPFIPQLFAGIFLSIRFIIDWAKNGFLTALKNLGLAIAAAERTIRGAVELAVAGSPDYTLVSVISIIVSIIILFLLVRAIQRVVFIGLTGSQAPLSAFIAAIVVVGIIEVVAILAAGEGLTFIPVWDGLLYLGRNIGPVVTNINWLPWL